MAVLDDLEQVAAVDTSGLPASLAPAPGCGIPRCFIL